MVAGMDTDLPRLAKSFAGHWKTDFSRLGTELGVFHNGGISTIYRSCSVVDFPRREPGLIFTFIPPVAWRHSRVENAEATVASLVEKSQNWLSYYFNEFVNVNGSLDFNKTLGLTGCDIIWQLTIIIRLSNKAVTWLKLSDTFWQTCFLYFENARSQKSGFSLSLICTFFSCKLW